MWDGFNKRKFPRINVRCEVSVISDEKTKPFSALTENLGVGGVCVVLEESFKRFQECQVSVELEEGKPRMKCKGRVVWVVPTSDAKGRKSQYDTGIEFVGLSVDEIKRVQDFLTTIQPQ